MRVLVCGGRDYRNVSAVRHALDVLHARRGITLIIEGGATGADQLAREWAQRRCIEFKTFDADWKALGKRAGPLRNQRMINEGKPDGAVAFPGGRGTADMIRRAEAAGLKVWRTGGWPK
jgi:predicted Rossmann-fold nucleotide-binding protein